MSKLILICGPAGIGKSTWCGRYCNAHPGESVFVLSADEFRKKLFGSYKQFPPNHNMKIIYDEMIRQARAILSAKENPTVILDTTMINDERRLYFVKQLMDFDERVLVLLRVKDVNILLEHNATRPEEKKVPVDVILDMNEHYYDPSPECLTYFTSSWTEIREE